MKIEGNLHTTLFYVLVVGLLAFPALLLIHLWLLGESLQQIALTPAAVLESWQQCFTVSIFYWICFLATILSMCICDGKVYTLSENGITIEIPLLSYRKNFAWKDLTFVALDRSFIPVDFSGFSNEYILFSQKKIHKPRWMNAPTYSFWHPLSAHYFVLCSEKMLSSEDITLLDRPGYCVNKTEFLAMLSSWSVTLPRG